MAAQGTWLCPTQLHRERLLDMEGKLTRPRAVMYGALAIAFLIGMPWIGAWTLIPLAASVLGYAVLRPRIAGSERPEYVIAATVVNAQILIGIGIALSGGPHSPTIAMLLLPIVTLPARFSPKRRVRGARRDHRGAAALHRRRRPRGLRRRPDVRDHRPRVLRRPRRVLRDADARGDGAALRRGARPAHRPAQPQGARRPLRGDRRSRRRSPARPSRCSPATWTTSSASTTSTATRAATRCSRTPPTCCASACARSS